MHKYTLNSKQVPSKNFLPNKVRQNIKISNPKKRLQIANFKPKKGSRTSPPLIYLSTPPREYIYVTTQNTTTIFPEKM